MYNTDTGLKEILTVMPTPLREGRHVLRSYDLGSNAHVVKLIIYHDFVESVEQVGCFWGVVDRPPGGKGWRRWPACTG
jgi:hypothetical protein